MGIAQVAVRDLNISKDDPLAGVFAETCMDLRETGQVKWP